MGYLCLVFVGLLSLATAELPCRLYDVTTMVRLLGKKASDPRQGGVGTGGYEVHSRTNAVGVPTGMVTWERPFDHPAWFTSFKDPLQNSKLTCVFNTTNICVGWESGVFKPARWVEEDPLFNWVKLDTTIKPEDNDRVYVNDKVEPRWLHFRHLREDSALKLKFRPGPGLKLYFGLAKDGVDEDNESGSGGGATDSDYENDDDDDPDEVRPSSPRFSQGLEFTYLSNSSTMFQAKVFKKLTSLRYFNEEFGSYQGIVDLPQPDTVVTVFVAKNEDGYACLWIDNTMGFDSRRCLLKLSSSFDSVMLAMNRGYDRSTFGLYRADLGSKALLGSKIDEPTLYPPWIMTPELTPEKRGGLCVSFRYYLSRGTTAKILFLPVINGTTKNALRTVRLQGTGKPVSTSQFELVKSKSLRKQTWRLKVEFSSNGTFILQSMRQCSGKGRDDVTVHLSIPEHVNATRGAYPPNQNQLATSKDTNIEGLVPKLGLGLRCPNTDISAKSEITKCYNGGLNVNGWCQCFPGFTGPLCKKACPPERFGADCGGSCNLLGKHDCVGIKMAAPGSKLQCARGYHGPQCDKRCEAGFYGQDCQLTCGHCSRSSCNRYTGLCDDSCKAGYGGSSCDTEVASAYRPYINGTGYNFIEGYLNISLSDETISSYPFFEIRYMLLRFPFKKSKKLLKLTSKTPTFRVDRLKPGQRYRVHAVLVHRSGELSRSDVRSKDAVIVETDCHANTTFTDVDVDPGNGVLSLRWNVTDGDPYVCQKTKYKIEIDSDNLEDPIMEEAEPNDNHKTITALLPNEGTVRLKAIYATKEGEWSNRFPFLKNIVTEKPSILKVLNKTSRTLELLWSKSDTNLEDVIDCKGEAMLCRGIPAPGVKQSVREGTFLLDKLDPFRVYTCTLQSFGTTMSAITEQEIPSGAPKPHPTPVKSVKNTTATIQWLGPDCFEINGLREGFRVMLYAEGKLINATEVSDDNSFSIVDEHFHNFENLEPETEYLAKIYVLNHIGVNPEYPLNITFKTKSKNPEAVRNLIVYKRTRTDLWLRWSEPEEFTYIAGSSAKITDDFLIVYSIHGENLKSEEIAMTRCKTWPDYFCHRIRGLIPNKSYTILVHSRESVQKMYGPATLVTAETKEGVPDPPENLQLVNSTANSIVVSWEIPVMLNSNPRYFVASVDLSDEEGSQELDLPVSKVPISDGIQIYQAKFKNLKPESNYTVVVGASMQGIRATLTVRTRSVPLNS